MSIRARHNDIIFIIEDDEAIGELIELVLSEELGYRICRYTHSYDMLRAVREIKPILFLIDYQLPDMSGLQLYDELRRMSEFEGVPAIMMSANLPWPELRQRHITGLQKPFELDELLQTVECVMGYSAHKS